MIFDPMGFRMSKSQPTPCGVPIWIAHHVIFIGVCKLFHYVVCIAGWTTKSVKAPNSIDYVSTGIYQML